MKPDNLLIWIRFSIVNLIIVAVYGVLMRYKIGFEFPYFEQKFLLHAHSHFAFTGWITHTLIVLMTSYLIYYKSAGTTGKYKLIIIANLVCAYGMLFSFTLGGYSGLSIFFSTTSVFIVYFFAWCFISDIRKSLVHCPGKNWFVAALLFYILSSFGTFYLAWMMATKSFEQHQYLASVYFFLHFQYNGWFFFASAGLLENRIRLLIPDYKQDKNIFLLFVLSCVPAYFLSVLWAKIPVWVYAATIVAAFMQVIGWVLLLKGIRPVLPAIKSKITPFVSYLFLIIAVCVSIKLLLQLFSTIPALSKLAYGFRPVVIAYLHLVLLAIISLFLLSYFYATGIISSNKLTVSALVVFIAGVFLNEFFLMIQGIASFTYLPIPKINEMLLLAAITIFAGAVMLLSSQLSSRKAPI